MLINNGLRFAFVKISFDFMDDTITAFRMRYAGKPTICVAIMRGTWYEIMLNRIPVAGLVIIDDMEWLLAAGTILPDEIVEEIGYRIESRYK